jgi:rhodanese-related sulfurtransferase
MKLKLSVMQALLTIVTASAFAASFADEPIPITANEAFDAVQMQSVPGTYVPGSASVVLVDARDPVEYYFNGAAAAATSIVLDSGKEIIPDWGKVRLIDDAKFIEYRVDGHYRRILVKKVAQIYTEGIAVNIPYWRWDGTAWNKDTEPFMVAVEALAFGDYDTVILYCRTGGRSSAAGRAIIDAGFFGSNVYEIDNPEDGLSSEGGFSGPVYGSFNDGYAHNGYSGFPGRITPPDPKLTQDASVSWLDSGLPIVSTVLPAASE